MSNIRTPEEERQVRLWHAYERLDHAYLVRDDYAVQRERALIAELREQAAATYSRERKPVPSLLDRVADFLAGTVEGLLVIPVKPVLVRTTGTTDTQQGQGDVQQDVRGALGPILVTVVVNGAELGVAIRGLDSAMEKRLLLFAESAGQLVDATAVPAASGSGFVSVTVPWTAGLPGQLVVAVLPPASEGDVRPGR